MLELLIIADDFTGALDTGVQFAGEGAETRVVTDRNYDYCAVEAGIQVLVMDAETRHLPAKEAYDVVYGIAIRGIASGIPYIYKKTDSALRGNIGSELTALLAASEKNILPFFPAFPKIGRTTEAGYHYINGIPVKESVFGQDPYDPVKCSYIPELIQRQSSVPVRTIRWNEEIGGTRVTPEIVVLDAQEDEQLEELGKQLLDMGGVIRDGGLRRIRGGITWTFEIEGSSACAGGILGEIPGDQWQLESDYHSATELRPAKRFPEA